MTHPAAPALAEIIGLSLHRVVRYEDGPIGLLLTDSQSRLSYLHVVAAGWRLVSDGELVDGSYHETGPDRISYAGVLKGQAIDKIDINSKADAEITLGNIHFIIWCAAAAEPTFMLFRPEVEALVVGPGEAWQHRLLAEDDPLHQVGTVAISAAER